MKIISFGNAKGGSGKTTSAALLCSGLCARGYRVTLLDCDPLFPLYDWAVGAVSRHATALRVSDARRMAAQIKAQRSQVDYLIIDLSGASSIMNALSFAMSDLVLVPMQGSVMDARGALHTIELIQTVADNQRAPIKTSLVLTRVSPMVVTNAVRFARQIVERRSVPFLPIPVLERSAYRDMFSHMTNLVDAEHEAISNLPKARRDIDRLTDAVADCMGHACA
ncbi:ParA family protein [Rhizobium sp. SSA_523]|uniref:ParA family protein n=1 Tax=Rhizobium sp. SSA_523 TaxID=2952477 RepID=UPI002091ADC3|nr:ParA family protein [Rhizobium sp. SSA_523]MCO5733788.1 ParA family protein [Rhizobium sp. SSA_523]WKC24937.1 ParA family protein [Rhizobium sp. SSA_523]